MIIIQYPPRQVMTFIKSIVRGLSSIFSNLAYNINKYEPPEWESHGALSLRDLHVSKQWETYK